MRHPGNKTALVFGVTIFRDTIEELPLLVDMAADLGVERLEVHHLHPSFQEHRYQSLVYHRSLCNRMLAEAKERATKNGVRLVGSSEFSLSSLERHRIRNRNPKRKRFRIGVFYHSVGYQSMNWGK